MIFKDVFFMVDPEQDSIMGGIEKVYTKTCSSMKETFQKYRELKKRYRRVRVCRVEDEYECDGYGTNILLNHRFYTLTES